MFPKVQKSDLDAKALGQEMLARKQALKAELGMVEEPQPMPPKRTNGSRQPAKAAK
jgi:hypothetical protein